ncbi:hypothetical protein N5P37_008153 [Trichoderma harzianum]|nr:hypothetical protein N5P37_008153 [Trichoderma harzianum]PKK53812.1 hypothetical protein CI102_1520 [Trichoderma harzianum]
MERYIEGLSLHHWPRRQKEAVPVKHVAQRHRGAKESGRRSGRDREARKGGRVDVLQRRDEGSSQQPGARTGEIDNNVTDDCQGPRATKNDI